MEIPPLKAFLIGYQEGVRYADPKVEVKSVFITKLPDFSGFVSPEKGKHFAKELYNQGVDIIYNVASLSGNGIIQEAKIQKKYVIGVDYDQDAMAKGYVLTSMIKRLDRSTYLEVKNFLDGKFKHGAKIYGIKEGGISLSEMKYTKHLIPDEILKKLKVIESKIISGEIKVTNYLLKQ